MATANAADPQRGVHPDSHAALTETGREAGNLLETALTEATMVQVLLVVSRYSSLSRLHG